MQYRMLGRTNLKVSLASFGTGGPSMLGQRKGLEQEQQNNLIHRCLELGINLFDTHESYGRSEEILGNALKGVPRDSYILVTKWAYHKDSVPRQDPQELVDSVERSLRRLQTNHIDVLLFHGLLPRDHDYVIERFVSTMEKLQEQGKIRFKGFSERFIEDPKHEGAAFGMKTRPDVWDVIMLKYGILNQYAVKEALPLAHKHNVGILNMASVRIKLPNPQLLEELIAEWKQKGYIPQDSLQEKDPLGWLVHDDVDSVISAAYRFAADHPAISTVITGTASVSHLESNVAALEKPGLPEADKQRVIKLFNEIAEYA